MPISMPRGGASTTTRRGVDYYGRPGFPSCGSEYDWDAAGRMTADTGRGISLIKYDHRILPV